MGQGKEEKVGQRLPAQDVSASELVQCVRRVMNETSSVAVASDDEDVQALIEDLLAIRNFTLALARGDTCQTLKTKGRMAGALKALQANLQHMTWQTKQVAGGDFSQRMDFLGEFSDAFNSMTIQLEDSRVKLRESEQRYRSLAMIDPLTGVFNRRHFLDVGTKEFRRAERKQATVAILMVDADHFKKVNDVYGHGVGDVVLCVVADLINESIRGEDILARYGGEEFIILCPDTTGEEALLVGERLRQSIEQAEIPVESGMLKVTVSVGTSVYEGTGSKVCMEDDHFAETIARADSALYQAKEDGRNRVCLFQTP